MNLTRDQLVVGASLTMGDDVTPVVVEAIGVKLVAVRYEDGEVDAWNISYVLANWSLPKPTKPEWVNDCWLNHSDRYVLGFHPTAEIADQYATSDRTGRVSLADGTWVPCKGTEVLG